MKERPKGFLAHVCDTDPEVFDYVRELHELLWRVARIGNPGVSGYLDDLIENNIERLERLGDVPLPPEPTHEMLKALAGDPAILAASDEAELRVRYAAMLRANSTRQPEGE